MISHYTIPLYQSIDPHNYILSLLGTVACDWLVAHVEGGIDRKKAVDVGVKLWAAGLFRHVSHRHRPFSDGANEYFRFITKSEHTKGRANHNLSFRLSLTSLIS